MTFFVIKKEKEKKVIKTFVGLKKWRKTKYL